MQLDEMSSIFVGVGLGGDFGDPQPELRLRTPLRPYLKRFPARARGSVPAT
jgi:hypothetical protein